jgi:hypothetical protein
MKTLIMQLSSVNVERVVEREFARETEEKTRPFLSLLLLPVAWTNIFSSTPPFMNNPVCQNFWVLGLCPS